jgi:ribosomal protein S18 acetylase RimI-like enzyme
MAVDYDDTADDSQPLEIDHSAPESDQFAALSHDRIPVRSMKKSDLEAIIRIDRKLSGGERRSYYQRKAHEVLEESGVRVSLVAELDDHPVGFIMARVDFGAFGHTMKEAVMDAIGVDPGYQGQGVGQALMSQLVTNLAVLRVETVRTEVSWDDTDLISYFAQAGFLPAQRVKLMAML